jgi:hypothetical protein
MYFEKDMPGFIVDLWEHVWAGITTGACIPCPTGSVSVANGIGIHSCICTSETSVVVEGSCVEVCHLTREGCPCHLSVHGELVGCGVDGSYLDSVFSTGSTLRETPVFSILEFGAVHACAILYPSGRVLCWNIVQPTHVGTRPQSEAPKFITDARALSLGVQHSCALWGVDNTLTCWGVPGIIGKTSEVRVSRNVRMLAVGHPKSRHVCFLYVSKMFVSCLGLNTHGQLGLGVAGEHIYHLHAEDIVSYM